MSVWPKNQLHLFLCVCVLLQKKSVFFRNLKSIQPAPPGSENCKNNGCFLRSISTDVTEQGSAGVIRSCFRKRDRRPLLPSCHHCAPVASGGYWRPGSVLCAREVKSDFLKKIYFFLRRKNGVRATHLPVSIIIALLTGAPVVRTSSGPSAASRITLSILRESYFRNRRF